MKKIILLFLTIFLSLFSINKVYTNLEFTSLPTNDNCIMPLTSQTTSNYVFNETGNTMFFSTLVGGGSIFRLYKINLDIPYDCTTYIGTSFLISETSINTRYSYNGGLNIYQGNLYIYDAFNKRIYKYDILNDVFSTIFSSSTLSIGYTFDTYNGIFTTISNGEYSRIQITNSGTIINNIVSIPFQINSVFSYDNYFYTVTNSVNFTIEKYHFTNNEFNFISETHIGGNSENFIFSNATKYTNNFLYSVGQSNNIRKLNFNNTNNNLTCETELINWPYNFNVKDGNLNDFIFLESTSDNPTFYSFKSGSSEYEVIFSKSKNFNNFNSGSILNENESYSFQNIFTTGINGSGIKIKSLTGNYNYIDGQGSTQNFNNPINFLYLDGNFIDDEFYFRSCGGVNEDYKTGKSQTSYTFDSTTCIELAFNKSFFGSNEIKDLRFGPRQSQIIETEICYNEDTGETFVLGDLFTGDLNDIGGVNPNTNLISIFDKNNPLFCDDFDFACHLRNSLNPSLDFEENEKNNTIANYIINKINTLFGYNDYLQYINILLPVNPSTNITLPFPYLNNNFQIALKYVDTELPVIDDRLNINAIESSPYSKIFISFILSIFYIIFRVTILYLIFYIFKLYYKYIILGVSSFFSPNLLNSQSGNIFSFGFYLIFLFSIFSTFIILFSYVLQLDLLILTTINYATVFFTFLALSFGDYSFFSGLTNTFFISIITGLLFYIVFLITNKFLRFN